MRHTVTVETLEGRQLLALAVGLRGADNLLFFDTDNPNVILEKREVTGLEDEERILGIDFRPTTGELFAVGSTNQLYTIDLSGSDAEADNVGIGLGTTLDGSEFDFDFNPTVDRIRFVSNAAENGRIHPDTGILVDSDLVTGGLQADTDLAYAAGDDNENVDPTVTAAAYSNNDNDGATATTLYAIDTFLNVLVMIGGPDGVPPPNEGELTTIGRLGLNATNISGFDITTDHNGNNTAFAALRHTPGKRSRLFTIDLETGDATRVGTIGAANKPMRDVAVAPSSANIAVLTTDNRILTINSAVPSLVLRETPITGLEDDEIMLGIDVRPATDELFGVTNQDRVYVIEPSTGLAVNAGDPTAVTLAGKNLGLDFNPTVDRLRFFNPADQNLRIDPNNGNIVDSDLLTDGVQTDDDIVFAAGDDNESENPNLVGAAYTNNTAGATQTTLFAIDSTLNVLVRVGGENGTPSPNTGEVTTIGELGFNATTAVGFDIVTSSTGVNTAYATFRVAGEDRVRLFTIDLTTGAATAVGFVGPDDAAIRGMTVLNT